MFVHVGQQAVVDLSGAPVGYELLFRTSGAASRADVVDGERATAQVLVATFLDFDLERLVGDRLAFVNLPRAFLVGDLPLPFAAGRVVLEVLEDVPADPEVVAGIVRLAAQGHLIALDDVTAQRDREQLLPLAHYVKIDLLGTDPADLPALVERCSGQGRQIIAEKVETEEQLRLCARLGVGLFQGYLTGRPETRTQTSLAPGQLACLRLLALLSEPDVQLDRVVAAVEAEPGLTVKVLQAANSPAAGLARRPGSVREAVLHVGLQTLQAWTTLLCLGTPSGRVPLEAALARGRMCQLLAESAPHGSSAFLTGLLSGLTDALQLSTDELLDHVAVAAPVAAALAGGEGPLGELLALVLGYESGPYDCPVDQRAEQARTAFLQARAWTAGTLGVVGVA